MKPVKAVALLLALFAVGCATSQINRGRQAVVAGVHVFVTGADALDGVRQAKEDELASAVESGKLTPDQAEAQYRAFMAKGRKAVKALVTLWDSIKFLAHVIEAADAKLQNDLPKAIGDLTAALASATQALADLGVKV